ncbi:MAG: Carboxylesterase NlhH [Pseudomonadota bacterium]|jgi:arylformamidase
MRAQTSAWYDSMYNNRALVPDHAAHFAQWAQTSADARASLKCNLDIAYGDGPNETLDIFPAKQKNAPVVVFIHGGYWRSLDKADHSFVAPPLHDMGACVVMVNYALCPGTEETPVTIPDIAQQMAKALAWTWHHIAQHGGNPQQVVVAGHSAGGHLAAMLLACDWKKIDPSIPAHWIQKALSISGLYDLTPLRKTPFLQTSLKLTAQHARMASPALWPRPKKGVLYTVAGGDESAEFLRHNRLIHQTWGPKTVPVCEDLAGLNHFSIVTDLTKKGTRLSALMKQLLSS